MLKQRSANFWADARRFDFGRTVVGLQIVLNMEKTIVKESTDREILIGQLRSEIAQLEARYDGLFPPGVYSVLDALRQELNALNLYPKSECDSGMD